MENKPGFFEMLKQYLKDAAPGGALNRELTPQGLFDAAALGTAPVPVLGDVVGLGADAYRYATQPEERTAGNYALTALGALPFIPSRSVFKGTLKTVHGSETPLKQIKSEKDPSLERMYEEGGVFGNSFYSSPVGNYEWFRGGSRLMPNFKHATQLEQTFKKAAVVRPDTVKDVLKQAGIKKLNNTVELKEALQKKGYDGIIVENVPDSSKDLRKLSEQFEQQGLGDADSFINLLQNQIASFNPTKNTRIIGEDPTLSPLLKQRNSLEDKIKSFYKADQAIYLANQLNSGQMSQSYALNRYGEDDFLKLLDTYAKITPLLAEKNKIDSVINKIAGVPTAKAEEFVDVFADSFESSVK